MSLSHQIAIELIDKKIAALGAKLQKLLDDHKELSDEILRHGHGSTSAMNWQMIELSMAIMTLKELREDLILEMSKTEQAYF